VRTRYCLACCTEKPLNAFPFFRRRNGKKARRYRCRVCQSLQRSQRDEASGKHVRRIHGSKVRDIQRKLKRCSRCKKWFPFVEFSPRSGERVHSLRSWCRKCDSVMNRSYWQKLPLEERKARKQQYRKNENPKKVYAQRLRRACKKLGFSAEDLALALEKLKACSACEICGQPETAKRFTRLTFDHNHITMRFRGLLCTRCNSAIGLFNEDVSRLLAAVLYLQKSS